MSKLISSYYTDGKPASMNRAENKGRRTAIGYWVNGRAVVSFPARLNAHKIPSLKDAAAIVRGDSVAEACERFNTAPRVNLEKPAAPVAQFFGIKHNGGAFVEVFRMLESDDEKTLCFPLSFTSAEEARAHLDSEAFPERERRAYRIERHAPGVTMTHAEAIARFMAQESNAVVMARAVDVVRDRRLAAEYVAGKDGDDCPALDLSALENLHREAAALDARINGAERSPTGDDYNALYTIVMRYAVPLVVHVVETSDDDENRRALDAEEARAAAARKLAGA